MLFTQQTVLQRLASAKHEQLGRTGAAAQLVADFADAQLRTIAHLDRIASALAESVHATRQVIDVVAVRFFRRLRRGGVELQAGLGPRGLFAAFAFANVLVQQVARDAQQPRTNRCRAVEAIPTGEATEERLLGEVFGVVSVEQPRAQEAVDDRLMPLDDLSESRAVAALRGLDKSVVLHGRLAGPNGE